MCGGCAMCGQGAVPASWTLRAGGEGPVGAQMFPPNACGGRCAFQLLYPCLALSKDTKTEADAVGSGPSASSL